MSIRVVSSGSPLYTRLTPAGAFHVIADAAPDQGQRKVLTHILREGDRAPFRPEMAAAWTGLSDPEAALESLFRLQRLGLLYGSPDPEQRVTGRLEDALPPLLTQLSADGRAILADENGFYLAAAGFHHESAEELAGLSADLLSLQARHDRLLKNNLRVRSEAWALVDPLGQAELGFWPLFIGIQRFLLIIGGAPLLQTPAFVSLVQALDHRYQS